MERLSTIMGVIAMFLAFCTVGVIENGAYWTVTVTTWVCFIASCVMTVAFAELARRQ